MWLCHKSRILACYSLASVAIGPDDCYDWIGYIKMNYRIRQSYHVNEPLHAWHFYVTARRNAWKLARNYINGIVYTGIVYNGIVYTWRILVGLYFDDNCWVSKRNSNIWGFFPKNFFHVYWQSFPFLTFFFIFILFLSFFPWVILQVSDGCDPFF